ncbi:MAG: hypothetical protein PHS92_01815 [Candidatus Gracilibacteria bacterium]|nr:hypothetical protein [Candidatus Gracilibacteria bacterium]
MKEFNLLKIYLVIIAIVGLIGGVIGYGNLAYQTIKYRLITPEEYLIGSYDNYQITQCEDPNYSGPYAKAIPSQTSTGTIAKTPEEIQKCKDLATKNVLAKRDFDYKDNVISSAIWGTIFLLLFITHFPVFLRRYKEDK